MKRIYLVSVFFILVSVAWSEKYTITVDMSVEMAMKNNLQIKQSAITLRTKKTALDSAFNVFIPSLEATASLNGSEQLFTNKESQVQKELSDSGALSVNLGGSLSLPVNTALFTGIAILREDYKAGLISYEQAEKKLERDVRKQFYLILGNKKNIDIQKSNINLAEKRLERAKKNFSLGLAAELDVISAEVNLGRLLPTYNNVLAQQENQQSLFKFLIGIKQEDELVLDGELITQFYELDSKELVNSHISKRLDVLELSHNILSLKKQKTSLLLSENSPSLLLGYNYQFNTTNSETSNSGLTPAQIDPWSDGVDRGTLSIALKWKLDGFIPYSKTDVKARKLQDTIDITTLAREATREQAIIEIINLVNSLNTAQKNIESNKKIVAQAERNYELTDEAYKVGSRDSLDVETAQNNLLSANQQLVLARYEYIAGLLDLEYALNIRREELPGIRNK